MDIRVRVAAQQIHVRLEFVMDFDTRNSIRSLERVIRAARIPQSDVEVVVVYDRARNGFA